MKYIRISFGIVVSCLLLIGCSFEKRDWEQTKAKDTTDGYVAFIQKHPKSQYVASAQAIIETKAWEQTKAKDTIDGYAAFIAQHPQSRYVAPAQAIIETKAWEQTKAKDTIDGYVAFIAQHPQSQYVASAQSIIETKTWEQTKATDTIDGYRAFVAEHPKSQYVASAQAIIDTKLWEQAKAADTIDGYRAFIDQHPTSQYVAAAREIIETKLWAQAKATNTIDGYRAFIAQHPNSQYNASAQALIEALAWDQAKAADSIEGYAAFIDKYPQSQHVEDAKAFSREVEKRIALEKIVAARDVAALKAFVADDANAGVLRRFKIGAGNSVEIPSQPKEAYEGYHLTLKAADEPGTLDYVLSIPAKIDIHVDFKGSVTAKIIKGNVLLVIRNNEVTGQMAGEEGVTMLVNLRNDRPILLSAEYVTIDPNMFVHLNEAEFVFTRMDGVTMKRELADNSFHVTKGALYHAVFR